MKGEGCAILVGLEGLHVSISFSCRFRFRSFLYLCCYFSRNKKNSKLCFTALYTSVLSRRQGTDERVQVVLSWHVLPLQRPASCLFFFSSLDTSASWQHLYALQDGSSKFYRFFLPVRCSNQRQTRFELLTSPFPSLPFPPLLGLQQRRLPFWRHPSSTDVLLQQPSRLS